MTQEYLVVPVGKEGLRKQDDKEPVGKGHRSQPRRASHGQSKNSLSNSMGRAGREGEGQADSMLSTERIVGPDPTSLRSLPGPKSR